MSNLVFFLCFRDSYLKGWGVLKIPVIPAQGRRQTCCLGIVKSPGSPPARGRHVPGRKTVFCITTVCAMMPLVLTPGAGSEFYRGLGSVVVGGILISTVFTIFLIPALLSLTFDAIGLFKRISIKFFRPQGKDTT